jgi:hypothetical protein
MGDEKLNCGNCIFSKSEDTPNWPTRMLCRKNPPVANEPHTFSVWPAIDTADWCGEHILNQALPKGDWEQEK